MVEGMLLADLSATKPRSRAPEIRVRPTTSNDGAAMWRLADESALDTNSPYAYLLWADQFSSTCRVAVDQSDKVIGFVMGHLIPERSESLFVWQIGVAKEARGGGVASRLLDELWQSVGEARFLEATVTPSNTASDRLFRGFANRHGGELVTFVAYGAELFPGNDHEAELSYQIGPIDRRN